jgi:hypothetical protein
MRDVATSAARDKDFRTQNLCAINNHNSAIGIGAQRPDAGHEAGRARADNRNINCSGYGVWGGHGAENGEDNSEETGGKVRNSQERRLWRKCRVD